MDTPRRRPATVEGSGTRVLLPALGRQPGHLLWRAHARVTATMAEVLPEGLDVHAYAVLLALGDGEPRSQRVLADQVGVSRTTMSKVAADLDRLGLVERVRNPGDRRSYALTRTAEGARALARWQPHVEGLSSALATGLDDAEQRELRDLLRRAAEPDLDPDTPAELLGSVGFLVGRLKFLTHRRFAELLAPLAIEPPHFGTLTVLGELGPVPQSEVARQLGLSGASVVQLADELGERGLVERRRGVDDRRSQELHLTPAAAPVVRRARELADELGRDRLAALDDTEAARLVELLRAFVTADPR